MNHRPLSDGGGAGTKPPFAVRLFWFAAIWAMSVTVLAVVAFLIKLAL
ncbi:MAG: DUF2474 family protein [Alphaproteobacteria bacterium]|nr:DUF2474 family protein [Alphaproteobacteria bacterium]